MKRSSSPAPRRVASTRMRHTAPGAKANRTGSPSERKKEAIAAIASFFLSDGDLVRLVFAPGTACRIRVKALRRGAGELLLFI